MVELERGERKDCDAVLLCHVVGIVDVVVGTWR
jgi:hypothetical protein